MDCTHEDDEYPTFSFTADNFAEYAMMAKQLGFTKHFCQVEGCTVPSSIEMHIGDESFPVCERHAKLINDLFEKKKSGV